MLRLLTWRATEKKFTPVGTATGVSHTEVSESPGAPLEPDVISFKRTVFPYRKDALFATVPDAPKIPETAAAAALVPFVSTHPPAAAS
jgi:hypothetical protein